MSETPYNTRHIVVGMGEIGRPIFRILSGIYHDTQSFDAIETSFTQQDNFDVLHICFGYKPGEEAEFWAWVAGYQKRFLKEGGLTIIHSSVGIGMSRSLGAVHSPVRGMHPNLESGIRTFTKFFGGERAGEAAELFRRAGLKTYVLDSSEATELGKISETTFYALQIEYIKHLKRECDKHGLSFAEVYTLPATCYNEGWKEMGHPEYCMPLLVPIMLPQGGHCTIPNAKLWETDFTKFILNLNDDNKK